MSSIIDRFFISVGLKTDDVEKGVHDLNNKLTSSFKGMAASIAAPLAGALSIGSMFQSFITEAANVDKLSKTLGVNIETMQAWMGAAESMGAEGDEVAELFHDVNDWASDLLHNDAGTLKEFVERGLVDGFTDAQGQMLKTEDIIMKVSGAVQKLGAQEGSGLLRRIGVGNKEMAGFLMMGPEQIAEYLRRQKELGAYTKEDAQIARDFTRAVSEMTRVFKMALVPVLSMVTPYITKFGDTLTRVLISIRKHPIVLKTLFIGLALVLVSTLVPSINAVKAASLALIRSPIGQFIALFVMLGLVIEDLFVYMRGGQSALPGLWAKFGTGEEIAAKLNGTFEQIKEVVSGVVDFFDKWGGKIAVVATAAMALGAVVKIVMAIVSAVKTAYKWFLKLRLLWSILQFALATLGIAGGVTFGAIAAAVAAVVWALYELYDNWEGVKEGFRRGLDAIAGFFVNAKKRIMEIMQGVFTWLSDKFGGIADTIGSVLSGIGNVISRSREANGLIAASGKNQVWNQTWSTDNSTTNQYVSMPMTGKNTQNDSYVFGSMRGLG